MRQPSVSANYKSCLMFAPIWSPEFQEHRHLQYSHLVCDILLCHPEQITELIKSDFCHSNSTTLESLMGTRISGREGKGLMVAHHLEYVAEKFLCILMIPDGPSVLEPPNPSQVTAVTICTYLSTSLG